MEPSQGSVLEEGITHEQFWDHQQRRGRLTRKTTERILREIEARLGTGPLLEIGVGTGHTLRGLADALPPKVSLVGIDHDAAILEYAGRNLAPYFNVRLTQADARRTLPFADGQFRAVFSEHTFHHLDGTESVLLEIRRVLADDGVFVLIDLDPRLLLSRAFFAAYPWAKRLGWCPPIHEAAYRSLKRAIPASELAPVLKRTGWCVEGRAKDRFCYVLTIVKSESGPREESTR